MTAEKQPAEVGPVERPLGLEPEREGQPRMYTATGPVPEAGHWYSPAAVRELLAAERERCARLCEDIACTAENWDPSDQDGQIAARYCADAIRKA